MDTLLNCELSHQYHYFAVKSKNVDVFDFCTIPENTTHLLFQYVIGHNPEWIKKLPPALEWISFHDCNLKLKVDAIKQQWPKVKEVFVHLGIRNTNLDIYDFSTIPTGTTHLFFEKIIDSHSGWIKKLPLWIRFVKFLNCALTTSLDEIEKQCPNLRITGVFLNENGGAKGAVLGTTLVETIGFTSTWRQSLHLMFDDIWCLSFEDVPYCFNFTDTLPKQLKTLEFKETFYDIGFLEKLINKRPDLNITGCFIYSSCFMPCIKHIALKLRQVNLSTFNFSYFNQVHECVVQEISCWKAFDDDAQWVNQLPKTLKNIEFIECNLVTKLARIKDRHPNVKVIGLDQTLKEDLLKNTLESAVLFQPQAIEAVLPSITNCINGTASKVPYGLLLFAGPTGVGKTELAITIAKALGRQAFCLNMNHYQQKDDLWQFLGASTAYTGQGGDFTTIAQNDSKAVIILDEIEKADPSIFDALLSVFSTGLLKNKKKNIEVNFCDTFIIMTSNLGTGGNDIVSDWANSKEAIKKVNSLLKKKSSAAFAGRITTIVPFRPFNRTQLISILKFEALSLAEVIKKKYQFKEMVIDNSVFEGVIDLVGVHSGARGVKQKMTDLVQGQPKYESYFSKHDQVRARWKEGQLSLEDASLQENSLEVLSKPSDAFILVEPEDDNTTPKEGILNGVNLSNYVFASIPITLEKLTCCNVSDSDAQWIKKLPINLKILEFKDSKLSTKLERITMERSELKILGLSRQIREAELKKILETTVLFQSNAIKTVLPSVLACLTGQSSKNPHGVVLFAGPTGVGKTELAETIASVLNRKCHTFNMTDYQHEHDRWNFVGAAKGYKDYEKGGRFTNTAKRDPKAVILLDEVEKAHSSIFKDLLAVLNNGVMHDNAGIEVNFRDTFIIMTSNLGVSGEEIVSDWNNSKAAAQQVRMLIKKNISPEFAGRVKTIIPFSPFDCETLIKVLQFHGINLAKEIKKERTIDLLFDDSIFKGIVDLVGIEGGARVPKNKLEALIQGNERFALFSPKDCVLATWKKGEVILDLRQQNLPESSPQFVSPKTSNCDVDSLYTPSSSSKPPRDPVQGVYGYENNDTTCFAGATLIEMRAMYANHPHAPLIYQQKRVEPVEQKEVRECILQHWDCPEGQQQDAAEFRHYLLGGTGGFRLPVNVFKNYLRDPEKIPTKQRLLKALGEEKNDQKLNAVRKTLLQLLEDEERSDGLVTDFINADKELLSGQDLSTYLQGILQTFPEAHIPQNSDDWDTADHLSFTLYSLGIYQLGQRDALIPYAELGGASDSHLTYTLKPTKENSDNTLQELINACGISAHFEHGCTPDFIPLDILRRKDEVAEKTFEPILLSSQVQVGNITYQVCGFTRHIGQYTNSGHYIGYTRLEDGQWAEFDDDKGCIIPFEAFANEKIKKNIRTLLLRRIQS